MTKHQDYRTILERHNYKIDWKEADKIHRRAILAALMIIRQPVWKVREEKQHELHKLNITLLRLARETMKANSPNYQRSLATQKHLLTFCEG